MNWNSIDEAAKKTFSITYWMNEMMKIRVHSELNFRLDIQTKIDLNWTNINRL